LLGRHFTLAPPRPSFPSRRPLLALDRMMTTEGTLLDITTHDSVLARRASDHLPLTAKLRMAGG
jgi:endonuclease/exonuclease/phosphatase family metal-dependent hydrolase